MNSTLSRTCVLSCVFRILQNSLQLIENACQHCAMHTPTALGFPLFLPHEKPSNISIVLVSFFSRSNFISTNLRYLCHGIHIFNSVRIIFSSMLRASTNIICIKKNEQNTLHREVLHEKRTMNPYKTSSNKV